MALGHHLAHHLQRLVEFTEGVCQPGGRELHQPRVATGEPRKRLASLFCIGVKIAKVWAKSTGSPASDE